MSEIDCIRSLKDEYDWVRRGAADKLILIGTRRSVEPLFILLSDTNSEVRCRAALALGNIGDTRAVEPLIEKLRSSHDGTRSAVAEALGKIRDLRAICHLIPLLKDKDWCVRWRADQALRHIGQNPINIPECQNAIICVEAQQNEYPDNQLFQELMQKLHSLSESNREFSIHFPTSSLVHKEWHRIPLTITNHSEKDIAAISVEFSGDCEIKRLKSQSITSKSQIATHIGVKPLSQGTVPIDIKVTYSLDDQVREQLFEEWIEVTSSSEDNKNCG